MFANSKKIVSNQDSTHKDLEKIVAKHLAYEFKRPVSDQVQLAFHKFHQLVQSRHLPIVLDSGCGVGESTFALAEQYPEHLIIGIDKSIHRLQRHLAYGDSDHPRVLFYQANLIDFWRLVHKAGWQVDKHYILYPNPWPLKKDLKKRFHANPVFPIILLVSNYIELRSNWAIYLQEFALACKMVHHETYHVTSFLPERAITPFEKKYMASGHELYRLVIDMENKCQQNP